MQFATLPFLGFFLAVIVVAWASRPFPTARKVFLLLASYAFYARWNLRLLVLILALSGLMWAAGEGIARSRRKGVRDAWLAVSVAGFLGTLGWFKYYAFFRDNVEALANAVGASSGLPVLEIVLPVGLSYLTFQALTYVIDLHRGYGFRAASPLDALLFMAFFPQVLIGPICRSRDLLPQLEAPPPEAFPDLSRAVSLLLSGLFKKVILATYLATHLVEDAFASPESFSSAELLIAAYAYSIQIYGDFSGYTDMAMGIALLLGVHIPDNFNRPYVAENIAEFWRRWHMTFSNWLRDYVFLPMGGSRGGRLRTWFNLMVVMWVTGIWHGADWTYVVWGSIHGVAMVAYKIVADGRRARGQDPKTMVHPTWYRVLAWTYTFHLVVLARIFFRSADMEVAFIYWRELLEGSVAGRGVEWLVLAFIAVGLGLNFFGHHLRARFIAWHDAVPTPLRPVVWTAAGLAVLVLQPADVAPYIYFAF